MFLLDIIEYNSHKDTQGNWSATRSWQISIYHDTAEKSVKKFTDFSEHFLPHHDLSWCEIMIDREVLFQ